MGFGETVTILSRTVTSQDAYGNDVYTAVETDVPGCAFAPAGSIELIQGQNTVIEQPTVYLATGTPAPAPTDRLRVRGDLYDVDGKPQEFHNPFTNNTPGPVVRLERVTG